MLYKWKYETPVGFSTIYMNSDGEYLTGLGLKGQEMKINIHLIVLKKT